MAFQMCQDVKFRGTQYLQDPEGKQNIELPGVEVTKPICGDTFETKDEAVASFQTKMEALKHRRFVSIFPSTLAVETFTADPKGPELLQVKTAWDRLVEILLATSVDTPYGY